MPKKIVGEHFCVSKKFWFRKLSRTGGGKVHGFVDFFYLTGPKRKVFEKISGIEKNIWIRGGISRFSVEVFMSHSAKKFRKEVLLLLRNFLVPKSFFDEKAGYLSFPSKSFGLTVPKNFVTKELFDVSLEGRLAPAFFSHNYKYFDQLLQTVKNKTTVLILVFKEFLQTSI